MSQGESREWVVNSPEYRSLYKMYMQERAKRITLESAMLIPKPVFADKDQPLVDAWAMAEEAIARARRKP